MIQGCWHVNIFISYKFWHETVLQSRFTTTVDTKFILYKKRNCESLDAVAQSCYVKKMFVKIWQNHCITYVSEFFLIELQDPGLSPAILLRKRLRRRCFPVNFSKDLKRAFSQDTSAAASAICWRRNLEYAPNVCHNISFCMLLLVLRKFDA